MPGQKSYCLRFSGFTVVHDKLSFALKNSRVKRPSKMPCKSPDPTAYEKEPVAWTGYLFKSKNKFNANRFSIYTRMVLLFYHTNTQTSNVLLDKRQLKQQYMHTLRICMYKSTCIYVHVIHLYACTTYRHTHVHVHIART